VSYTGRAAACELRGLCARPPAIEIGEVLVALVSSPSTIRITREESRNLTRLVGDGISINLNYEKSRWPCESGRGRLDQSIVGAKHQREKLR
jgi:hypothetical protein